MASNGAVVAACFNRPFLPHAATMLRSLAASGSDVDTVLVTADETVTDAEMRRLLDFARSCGLPAERLHVDDRLLEGFGARGKYPRTAWFRAALPEAVGALDRLLYLDCDVLVLHDLGVLWRAELRDDHGFGAVTHPSYNHRVVDYAAHLRMPADTPLLNSGVLLMDIQRLRACEYGRRLRDFVANPTISSLLYADQDALNVVFERSWTALDPMWNCIASIAMPFLYGASWRDDTFHDPDVLERAARSPAIVHFNGPVEWRPWHRRCFHSFRSLYHAYRADTPWPLTEREGTAKDRLLACVPPKVQARVGLVRAQRRQRR